MKIIHTADLHLESSLTTNYSLSIAKQRKDELLDAFSRLICRAVLENVKVIIIAGDMFDKKKVTKKTKETILNLINSYPQIDFLYLNGNHDEDNFMENLIDSPSNLKVFKDNWTYFEYDDVVISGIVFNKKSRNYLYDTLNLRSDKKNIVVMHGEITQHHDANKINLKLLMNKNIDYLALGHIHISSLEKLDDRGVYAYCGCLEGRGYDECGIKGFYLLDSSNLKKPEFVNNSQRIIHRIEFDVTPYTDWFSFQNDVFDSISKVPSKDIVAIILKGKYSLEFDKKLDLLNNKLNELFFCAKIKDDSTLYIDPLSYKNDLSLKAEFIKNVLNSSLKEEEKNQIIEYGIHALIGDDL